MIYRCFNGHISFARKLFQCGMKGCERPVDVISEIDIDWLYKISPEGLSMKEDDLHKILGDKNMPKEVKDMISETFPGLKKKRLRFW